MPRATAPPLREVRLLGLLELALALEAEDLGERRDLLLDVHERLRRVKICFAVACIAVSAERIRWFAQMTILKPASRKTSVGVV